jgi:hypothetical protein
VFALHAFTCVFGAEIQIAYWLHTDCALIPRYEHKQEWRQNDANNRWMQKHFECAKFQIPYVMWTLFTSSNPRCSLARWPAGTMCELLWIRYLLIPEVSTDDQRMFNTFTTFCNFFKSLILLTLCICLFCDFTRYLAFGCSWVVRILFTFYSRKAIKISVFAVERKSSYYHRIGELDCAAKRLIWEMSNDIRIKLWDCSL